MVIWSLGNVPFVSTAISNNIKAIIKLQTMCTHGEDQIKEEIQKLWRFILSFWFKVQDLEICIVKGYQFDHVFDWIILKYPQIGTSFRTQIQSWNPGQNVGTSAEKPERNSGISRGGNFKPFSYDRADSGNRVMFYA